MVRSGETGRRRQPAPVVVPPSPTGCVLVEIGHSPTLAAPVRAWRSSARDCGTPGRVEVHSEVEGVLGRIACRGKGSGFAGQAEVVEDSAAGGGMGDEGNQTTGAAAAGAVKDVDGEDSTEKFGPIDRASGLGATTATPVGAGPVGYSWGQGPPSRAGRSEPLIGCRPASVNARNSRLFEPVYRNPKRP
jgi:hypothetical protein